MVKLLQLQRALLKASGRNGKKEILKDFLRFQNIPSQLKYILDPHIKYGLTVDGIKNRMPQDTAGKGIPYWSEWQGILDILSKNPANSDAHKKMVALYIANCSSEWHDLLWSFIDKDLKGSGIQFKTLNDVAPESDKIPHLKVALARPLEQLDHMPFVPAMASRKIDGVRVIAVVESADKIRYLSRGGNTFHTLGKLTPILSKFPGYVFDGECCVMDSQGNDNFQSAVSLIKGKSLGEIEHPLFYVFDVLTYEQYFTDKPSKIFSDRYSELVKLIPNNPYIKVVKQELISRLAELQTIFKKSQEDRWEGIMLRDPDSRWVGKRHASLVKVKAFNEKEFPIVGFIEGEGSIKGMLGALKVKINKSDIVDVGSGYTLLQRKELWKVRNDLIGQQVTVKYFEVTKNLNGTFSLRFPIYKGIRNYE